MGCPRLVGADVGGAATQHGTPDGIATAVVQGASGAIGSAFVRALLDRSPDTSVVATARDAGRLDAALGALASNEPRLRLVAFDPGDDDAWPGQAEEVLAAAPRIDLLIHASGRLHGEGTRPEKKLEQVERAALLQSFDANAIVPLIATRALWPGLRAASAPRVAMLSARVGSIEDNGLGGWYGYRASKAALNMVVRTLSIELARRAPGSVCVALHPGTVASPLSAPFTGARTKRFEPAFAADRLLDVLAGLGPDQTGSFWAWDGTAIPW